MAVARAMSRARALQLALPGMEARLDESWTTMRLAERKLAVVEAMLNEAEAEAARCEREIGDCEEELAGDDALGQLGAVRRTELECEVPVAGRAIAGAGS